MSSSSVELKDRSGGNGGTASVAADTASGNDWSCGDSECKHVNFGRRTTCQKCQRERSVERSSSSGGSSKKKLGTEIGKAAAEKSRGLFSAEDWQCSKCANVNWARRQTCNMCNAPKFCDVEERTGYGGGYNDRGVVEYKERSESDSEYDEFGRLKKRKSTRNHSDKDNILEEKVQLPRKDVGEEEEDDEEDDDGDGDLSKYDLWGDDEVVAVVAKSSIAKANVKSVTEKTNSRSRSRSASNSSRSSGSSSTITTSSSSSSSSTSSSTGGSSRSGSSSASTGDRKPRSRTRRHSVTVEADEENHKVTVEKRSRSKTHSHSSHKSTCHTTKSRSRSTSSAKKRRREHSNAAERAKDRSRSHSHSRKYSNSNASSTKYKRSNSSRSPATRYRKRSRTRSRSLSAVRRRR